ncbi:glycosyltransferase family 2 protein [Candidatus Igneacidithiobacillus taiwanensis]|uniref:glycosyltransferase family 2 protein n=1 Tax=Candidatus Igneacidithiobacillus taiwanensis TaxID=1945924 RepID=UPI002899B5E9|nr:glycosyltransferase family 2 protein [Candidatus Igneacidithiobacillus taiwanensis]
MEHLTVPHTPFFLKGPALLPDIDINIVTFNSSKWIETFVASLLQTTYPKNKLHLHFIDNSSNDNTVTLLQRLTTVITSNGITVDITVSPNQGFGAGQNIAATKGHCELMLISNVDLEFEPHTILRLVGKALTSPPDIAVWECRQKPYEHPKFYDPVTQYTSWNSHACVLMRRSAFNEAGGYDSNIFLYGEDVDLSYRLRNLGYNLQYCPDAVVWHHSYTSENHSKPQQDLWGKANHLYLRAKFGTLPQLLMIIPLAAAWLVRSPRYKYGRMNALRGIMIALKILPSALKSRKLTKRKRIFDFTNFDYGIRRYGAYYEYHKAGSDSPLVSVITRTQGNRPQQLAQAMLSVINQSYKNIEHIIIEDGGNRSQETVNRLKKLGNTNIRFYPIEKLGRSAAGNIGIENARGRYLLFLDDDDLLFAEHIEVLVSSVLRNPQVAGAYSLAWEVPTRMISSSSYHEFCYILRRKYMQDFNRDIFLKYNYWPIQSVLFHKGLSLDYGGFDTTLDSLEDWDLWIRYTRDNEFIYVPKTTSLYRVPADRQTAVARTLALYRAKKIFMNKLEAKLHY